MPRTKAPDRERYPNGRAKPVEGPTPETAKKHQERAEALHIPANKEAGYAESTIGVLEARGLISIEQAELCKKLANLRSVLYGSGNAKCSSIENVGRGLPNDSETKSMRETWAAYKAATADMEQADRRLFEHVVLRNNYREWMKLGDQQLFERVRDRFLADPVTWDNFYHDGEFQVWINGRYREVRKLLRVIRFICQRMPGAMRSTRSDAKLHTGAISDAQANALYGGETELDKLYLEKAKRGER